MAFSGLAGRLPRVVNYSAGQTRGNNAIILTGPSAGLAVRCNQASGTTHAILDVNGYFE